MITVNEARELTNNKKAEDKRMFELSVQYYIDNDVTKAIKREAENGENKAYVKYNGNMYTQDFRKRVVEVLENAGYTTRPANRYGFYVEW